MELPADALYGATTQRAVLNFPISGYRFSRPFIRALGLVKWAAALANRDLGKLDEKRAQLITEAAEEVIDGQWDSQFPIDIFQTGSGTSTNMNANEVIANRCSQLDGKAIGSKERQLDDETFRSRAPKKIIRGLEATLATQRIEMQKLTERFEQLDC